MIGFLHTYKSFEEVMMLWGMLYEDVLFQGFMILWISILLLVLVSICVPFILFYLSQKEKKREKQEKKKLLTQILMQKELENEVEKEIEDQENKL